MRLKQKSLTMKNGSFRALVLRCSWSKRDDKVSKSTSLPFEKRALPGSLTMNSLSV